jgi:hypothetical protein
VLLRHQLNVALRRPGRSPRPKRASGSQLGNPTNFQVACSLGRSVQTAAADDAIGAFGFQGPQSMAPMINPFDAGG